MNQIYLWQLSPVVIWCNSHWWIDLLIDVFVYWFLYFFIYLTICYLFIYIFICVYFFFFFCNVYYWIIVFLLCRAANHNTCVNGDRVRTVHCTSIFQFWTTVFCCAGQPTVCGGPECMSSTVWTRVRTWTLWPGSCCKVRPFHCWVSCYTLLYTNMSTGMCVQHLPMHVHIHV